MENSDHAKRLPVNTDNTYNIVGYVVAAIISIAGGFFIYEIIANSSLTFEAQWNMFKSPLGNICIGIGFLMAIIWWGKFTHWSATPVVETRDSWGGVIERKENYDITEQLFAKVLLPFLGHFVIEPLIYGAIIYYPLQCIIAVVGSIFPYILSLLVLGVIILFWLFTRLFHFRYQILTLIIAGILFSGAFIWGSIAIDESSLSDTISFVSSKPAPTIIEQTEEVDEIEPTTIIESEDERDSEDASAAVIPQTGFNMFSSLMGTAFSCVIYGILITTIIMGILLVLLLAINKDIIHSVVFYIVGALLALFLTFQFTLMMGAAETQSAVDSAYDYICELVESKSGTISTDESQEMLESITEEYPIIGLFMSKTDFMMADSEDFPDVFQETMTGFLDSYFWHRVWWSLGAIVIACLIVAFLPKPTKTRQKGTIDVNEDLFLTGME